MSCRRNRCINRTGQVMGAFGIPEIALRGPGCINGTGECNVAGARGRCTNVFGTGKDFVNRYDDEVMGSGGGIRCDRFDDEVMGAGGRRRRDCDDVMGRGSRHKNWNCCDFIWSYLETPFTVPR